MTIGEKKGLSFGKIVLIGCGSLFLAGALVMVIGLFWILSQPEGGVKLANEMDQYALDYLSDHNILEPDEQLTAYYDATILMDGTDAVILTTRRVIHHRDGKTTAVLLKDIEDITHHYETLTGDVFEIISKIGLPMKIEVAPLNNGETFRNVLMNAWKKSKQREEPAPYS